MTRRGFTLATRYAAVLLLIGVVAAGVLSMTALTSFFGSAPNAEPALQANFVRAVDRAGDGGKVALADVVPGTWDTAYVWDGYSADTDHAVFPGVDFGLGAHGQDYVVAFATGGNLVSWVRFNVNDPLVYFDLPTGGVNVLRDSALFTVVKDGNYPAGYLLRLDE